MDPFLFALFAVVIMPPALNMASVTRSLISLCQLFISTSPDRESALEKLERCREACRTVIDTLGPKPLTYNMIKLWEVVTTVLVFDGHPSETDLVTCIPYQGPTENHPVAA